MSRYGSDKSGLKARLEFGDRQPANAGQKYLLACYPDSGRQETAGQPNFTSITQTQGSKFPLVR